MSQILIDTHSYRDSMYLTLRGNLVHGENSAGALREAVSTCLRSHPPLLVINMMGLKKIDAGGIGALVFARVSAELAGAQIQLSGLTNRMRDLLVLTKLITVFDSAAIDKAA